MVTRLTVAWETTDEGMWLLVRRFPAVKSLETEREHFPFVQRDGRRDTGGEHPHWAHVSPHQQVPQGDGRGDADSDPHLTELVLQGDARGVGGGASSRDRLLQPQHSLEVDLPALWERGAATTERPSTGRRRSPRRIRARAMPALAACLVCM
jgi:hypothetical protein